MESYNLDVRKMASTENLKMDRGFVLSDQRPQIIETVLDNGLAQNPAMNLSRGLTPRHTGGRDVSPSHRPPLPPGNTPSTHFCYRMSRSHGHSVAGRIVIM